MNEILSNENLESGFFAFFAPLLGLLFFGIVALLRDILSGFFLTRLRLARGELGSPKASSLFLSKWFLTIGKLKFHFASDWIWLVLLALQTTTLLLLPIGGESLIHIERSTIVFVLLSLTTAVVAALACLKSPSRGSSLEVVRQVQKSTVGACAILLVLIGLSLGTGTENFSQIGLKPFLCLQSPFHFLTLLLCFFLIAVTETDLPENKQGRGFELIINQNSQILWMSLVVVLFFGFLTSAPEAIFVETVFKTALLLVFSDIVRSFMAAMSYRFVERLSLIILLPLLLISALHLLWRDLWL